METQLFVANLLMLINIHPATITEAFSNCTVFKQNSGMHFYDQAIIDIVNHIM